MVLAWLTLFRRLFVCCRPQWQLCMWDFLGVEGSVFWIRFDFLQQKGRSPVVFKLFSKVVHIDTGRISTANKTLWRFWISLFWEEWSFTSCNRGMTSLLDSVAQKEEEFYTVSWAVGDGGSPLLACSGSNGVIRIVDCGTEKLLKVGAFYLVSCLSRDWLCDLVTWHSSCTAAMYSKNVLVNKCYHDDKGREIQGLGTLLEYICHPKSIHWFGLLGQSFVGHGDSVNELRTQTLKPCLIASASKVWN